MPSMKAIKRRITSVKNIQQIMKAMNLVAASKVQRNRNKLMAVRPMFDAAAEFMEQGVFHQDVMESVFYEPRDVKRTAYIVISGERGLCGSYNANILRAAFKDMDDNKKSERVIAVGGKCKEYFVRRDKNVVAEHKGILENVSYGDASELAQHVVSLYLSDDPDERVDEVYIAYTKFETLLSHTPTVMKLLPFEVPKIAEEPNVEYEPDVLTYLRKAVPEYMTMFIYGAMTEAAVCEQASRMTSMDAAARNAGEIVDDLTLAFNRQRQGAITQEISEIVGGANAI